MKRSVVESEGFPLLSLLMDGKYGVSGVKWNGWCEYLCLRRGSVVRLSLAPRVIRDVCVAGDCVAIGCSRSVLLYRVRRVSRVMEVSGLWKRVELRGELIALSVYDGVLYVFVNRGSKNVLLKCVEELVVSEVSSVNGACCVTSWGGELCVAYCGVELCVKKGDECVYSARLRSECVCCVGEREALWLGCRNGDVLCVRDGRMKRVCVMRGGVKRLSVSVGGVVVIGMRDELLCMVEVSEGEWLKKRMRGVSGVMLNEGVLLSDGDGVCYGKELLFEESGIEYMRVDGDLLLMGKRENEVLLKRIGGELSEASF